MNKFISLVPLARKNKIFFSTAALTMMLSGPSLFANQDQQQQRADEQQTNTQRQESGQSLRVTGLYPDLYKATGVMGKTVKNDKDQELGEISELVIDKSGQVKYAVLAHGGTLGVGEKRSAISWDLFQISPEGDHYILTLDATQEGLANAPSFKEGNWPAQAQVTDASTLQKQSAEGQQSYQEEQFSEESTASANQQLASGQSAASAGQQSTREQSAMSGGQQEEQFRLQRQGLVEEERNVSSRFSELDSNQDGFISQEEASSSQKLSSNFNRLDQNSDQKIDHSEFSAFEPQRQAGATTPQTVTVKSGDTLTSIAEEVYGDANKWRLIYEANQDKIEDPRELLAGTKLTIPSPNE